MSQSCSRALTALVLGLAIGVGACSDGSEPMVPGSLQVMAGAGQSAAAGSVVPVAPSVKLLTTSGKPLAGAQVTFAASSDGAVTPAQQTTNAQGVATLTSWTLPRRAGSHQLTVSSAGVTPITITATATAGAAARLTHGAPPQQDGTVATDVGAAPLVLVSDAHDNPVAGATVRYTASGNGVVRVAFAVSDANGLARSEGWTLGTAAGVQTLHASLPALPEVGPLVFTANAAAGGAAQLGLVRQPATTSGAGEPLRIQPVVDVQDNFGNRVMSAAHDVTAAVMAGSTQTLAGTITVRAANGRATFTDLVVNGAGPVQLRFSAGGLPDVASMTFDVPAATVCPGAALSLNYGLGQSQRFVTSANDTPLCFDFTTAANAGQQYLVQIENMSMLGNSNTGVFPGFSEEQAGFDIAVTTGTLGTTSQAARVTTQAPADAVHSWDFGGGRIYEIEPPEPAGGARPALVKRGDLMLDASAAGADVMVGDTIVANMVGIPRLGIPDGAQKAVVRYAGPDLIIAEDVRLPTLLRQNGGTNTPLTPEDMQAIAADYARYAKVQADRFFGGRYNAATEASGGRPIAIHSLMYADNIWGYTFPSGNYFVWDFWVGTNGSTKSTNQQIQRNSNNLFMHEIAHMRHTGMNERANRPVRGNRWLVEGFARATERWPIAMRLLGTANPSRTDNVILPGHPISTLNSLEDVPVYTQTSLSMYLGYATSSYVFDYFADQVERSGGDWMTALGEFLVNAGIEADLNRVIGRHLPGLDFGTLFTRARIAFYTDDLGGALPEWTQYHQFQLRASRTTLNPQLDPRNMWPRIGPGLPFSDARSITPGGAFGYVIDGTIATGNARVLFDVPRAGYGVISVTRIK